MVERRERQLFRVSPAAYVDERARLVRESRAAGDRQAAKDLQALKRPTLAMWAVVAAADDAEGVHELMRATDELQAAQGSGDRAATVEATKRRKTALEVVVAAAVDALRAWEPSAEARRPEIRTLVDQISRHPELIDPWLDGTLRELPESDAFGFAAFTGFEPVARPTADDSPRPRPERRLRSVPPLPASPDAGDRSTEVRGRSRQQDGGGSAMRVPHTDPDAGAAREARAAQAAEEAQRAREARSARAQRVVAAREARHDVEAAARTLASVERRLAAADAAVREAEEARRELATERNAAAQRHLEAAARLAEFDDG